MGKLDSRSVIVTGGARGLGRAISLAFAREGANIAVVDVCHGLDHIAYSLASEKQLNETVRAIKTLGQKAIGIKANVAMSTEVREMVNKTMTEFHRIDVLVNNAAVVQKQRSIVDLDEEEWDQVLSVNLKGTFLCCKHVVPYMVQQRGGKVINISSVVGREYLGHPKDAAYNVSKSAIITLTQTLAKEVAEHSINVNAVCPGAVYTPMVEEFFRTYMPTANSRRSYMNICKNRHVFKRELTAQDVANAVIWLASENACNITGQAINVDAGWSLLGTPR